MSPLAMAPAWSAGKSQGPTVVAEGLNNPRQLSFDGDKLYVAEAGTGGSGPCLEGPEGQVCFGTSGAVTRIDRRGQRQVITELPSLAAPDGSNAIGASDVLVKGKSYSLLLGLALDPALRAGLGEQGSQLATFQEGRFGGDRQVVADLGAHESATDPDGAGPDSNPTGMVFSGDSTYVADAGGNSLIKLRHNREISTIATLPPQMADAPPFLGLPEGTQIPSQAVPTSVAVGPDGALYVSQLTGMPFPVGGSSITRFKAGEEARVVATGLTNVTDLAWYRGSLYAIQLTDEGMLNVPEGQLPSGSLVKIVDGAPQTVVDDLVAPYGIAFNKGSAYITTCAICAGNGNVIKVKLAKH